MPWLPVPAAVRTRLEVVLHRIDDPMILNRTSEHGGKQFDSFDIWELRIVYVFDAGQGRWSVGTITPVGYRRGGRAQGPRIEVQATNPEIRALAQEHMPDWIPDPSKARLHLPAEDVWNEAERALIDIRTDGTRYRRVVIEPRPDNPYEGE